MKSRKYAISAGIATMLATTSVGLMSLPQALAATNSIQVPKFSAQQAENLARTTFSIPSSYQLQSESFQQQSATGASMATATYSFAFAPANNAMGQNINVTVDANTGSIVNFNEYGGSQNFQFPVPTSQAQAQQIAENWARKLYPSQYQQTKLIAVPSTQNSLRYPVSYQFNFERMVNGIPAPFNGFTITIDQQGNLTNVSDTWSNLTFPTTNTVSQSQADSIYKSALSLHLAYTQVWHQNQQPTDVLMYTNAAQAYGWWGAQFANQDNVTGPVLNAATGKWENSDGSAATLTPYTAPKPLVTNGPTQDPMTGTANWSEQQALTYAEKAISIPAGATLTDENQWQAQQNDQTWHFSWNTKDGETLNVTVDSTHGFLQSFYQWSQQPVTANNGSQSQPAKMLSAQQLMDSATAFVKQVLPNDTGAVSVTAMQNQSNMVAPGQPVSFQITVITNGVPNTMESGNLELNSATGQVVNYYFSDGSSTSTPLPSPSKAISEDAAKTTWIENQPLQLMYLQTSPNVKLQPMTPTGTSTTPTPSVVLVYAPTSAVNLGVLNAITGQFESSGQAAPYAGTINDIKNLTSAPQIQLLVQRGLLTVDANGNVHPEQTMTNGAFVKLLIDSLQLTRFYNEFSASTSATAAQAMAFVPVTSPNYQEVAAAYAIGLIPVTEQFQPNALITRSTAAQMIARVLGLQPLLSHGADFNFTPKDLSQINPSDVAGDALANMFGIFTLQNGNFNPNGYVTVADAAIAVVQAANVGAQMNVTGGPQPMMG